MPSPFYSNSASYRWASVTDLNGLWDAHPLPSPFVQWPPFGWHNRSAFGAQNTGFWSPQTTELDVGDDGTPVAKPAWPSWGPWLPQSEVDPGFPEGWPMVNDPVPGLGSPVGKGLPNANPFGNLSFFMANLNKYLSTATDLTQTPLPDGPNFKGARKL